MYGITRLHLAAVARRHPDAAAFEPEQLAHEKKGISRVPNRTDSASAYSVIATTVLRYRAVIPHLRSHGTLPVC